MVSTAAQPSVDTPVQDGRLRHVRTLVIIPTYCEVDNVARVLPAIRRSAPSVDILVVDDASPDGTAARVREIAEEHGSIDLLERPAKSGLGSAYRDGFRYGIDRDYDVLVEMDADLSHDPAALPGLLRPLELNPSVSLVVGSRYVHGGSIPDWPWFRRQLSEWGNRYASAALGFTVKDSTSGFRAYRAPIVAGLDLDAIRADGYGFQIEMAYRIHRGGGSIVETPIEFTDRTEGESKMSSRIIAEALFLVTGWAIRDRLLRRNA